MTGIFDSGLGGLTALKEIKKLLPSEELVYFGDTGRVPYGTRSKEIIVKYSRQDIAFLRSMGVDTIVVACGTVSTVALDILKNEVNIPLIGVVEGAAEAAAKSTVNGIVGVIGTQATIRSGAFEKKLRELSPEIRTATKACPLLVPLVENGYIARDDEVTRMVCERYLEPIHESHADTLILGCTHYPIIEGIIADLLPGVTLINTGAEAARRLAALRGIHEKGTDAPVRYYVSDDTAMFSESASLFLGSDIAGKVEKVDIENY